MVIINIIIFLTTRFSVFSIVYTTTQVVSSNFKSRAKMKGFLTDSNALWVIHVLSSNPSRTLSFLRKSHFKAEAGSPPFF